jgi:hypothetical protein
VIKNGRREGATENDNLRARATGQAAEYAASTSLRLPEFWPDTPNSWFVYDERKLHVCGIVSESVKFDLLVRCLPRASLRQVLDVIENPHATEPYTTLKRRLMSLHDMTKFQRIVRLSSRWRLWAAGSLQSC